MIKRGETMSLTNELFARYCVKTESELFTKKTDEKTMQHKGMPNNGKVPIIVSLTADKCKSLCEASGLEYVVGYENRVIERIVTTEATDRDGDIIRAKGIDNSNYRKNPVVLFAHNKGSIPVGNSIKEWLDKEIIGWKSWDLFLDGTVDTTGWSDLIFRFVKSGAMPGASIGFIPVKAKYDHTPEEREKIGLGKYGVEYMSVEKLEHSACAVPANQEALAAHLKSVDRNIAMKNITKTDFDIMCKDNMFNGNIIDVFKSVLFDAKKTFSLPDIKIPEHKVTCSGCGKDFEYNDQAEVCIGAVKCPDCDVIINQYGKVFEDEDIEKEEILKPYPNEHAARIKDPSEFKQDSFKRKKIDDGISIIVGKLTNGDTMVTQAYRFDSKKFTAQEARTWLSDHKIKYIKFEAASGKSIDQPVINMSISMDSIATEISTVAKKIEELNKSIEGFEKTLIEKCDTIMTRIEKTISASDEKHSKSLYDRSDIEEILKM